ncbi:MAG TPA: hypothetical protein DDZ88_14700, partial [Verrucomicrobiales bacterium]|nr:hypothetical protein [Verrucomicrobiales bacterium]
QCAADTSVDHATAEFTSQCAADTSVVYATAELAPQCAADTPVDHAAAAEHATDQRTFKRPLSGRSKKTPTVRR